MELLYRGVVYTFEYDYAPNWEGAPTAITETRSGRGLDGSVHITHVYRDGRLTPVSVELLRLMEDTAAEDAIASGCPTVSDDFLRLIREAPAPRGQRRS